MSLHDEIVELVKKHELYRENCINLVASENVISENVKRALGSDLASRYVARPKYYGGTQFMEEIWEEAEKRARRLFEAKFANVNAIGGHIALMSALCALRDQDTLISSVSPENGGYPGLAKERSLVSLLRLRVEHLPFNTSEFNIDIEKSLEFLEKRKPSVVVLGASVLLFPQPVSQISKAVHEYGGKVVYDGSHVMGLIAGGEFQNPLREGADILLGSTHKSFFGPQGGILLTNDEELFQRVSSQFFHVTMDNPHPNRIAALAIALAEMEKFGREYASNVVKNSKTLARELAQKSFPVLHNSKGEFTSSHQIVLQFGAFKSGVEFRDKLEEANIIVDSGVRIGTSEVTRRGYVEGDMKEVARAIGLAWQGKTEEAKGFVHHLVNEHKTLKFC